jgi:hypothetical protein
LVKQSRTTRIVEKLGGGGLGDPALGAARLRGRFSLENKQGRGEEEKTKYEDKEPFHDVVTPIP